MLKLLPVVVLPDLLQEAPATTPGVWCPWGFWKESLAYVSGCEDHPQELCSVLRSAQGPGACALVAERREQGSLYWYLNSHSNGLSNNYCSRHTLSFCRVLSCSRKETWNYCWGRLLLPKPRLRLCREGPSLNTLLTCSGWAQAPTPAAVGGTPEEAGFCWLRLCIHSSPPPSFLAAHSTLCPLQGAGPQRKRVSLQWLAPGCRNQESPPQLSSTTDVDTRVAAGGGKNTVALNTDTSFSLPHRLSGLLCLHN